MIGWPTTPAPSPPPCATCPPALRPDVRDPAETHLVEQAQQFEPRHFATLAAHLITTLDPDGTLDDRDPASKARTHHGTRNRATGLTPITGRLDDLGIATVRTALDGLAAPCPADPGGKRDTRPAATRRAHALVAALRHALDAGPSPARADADDPTSPSPSPSPSWRTSQPKPCSTTAPCCPPPRPAPCSATRTSCPPSSAATGKFLDIGRASRTFPIAVRRAITLRDRGCIWPGCDRPATWAEFHHVIPWSHGGPTSATNGVLLCPHRHQEIHRTEWEIRFRPDGVPELIPPHHLDHTREPQRNILHRTDVADRVVLRCVCSPESTSTGIRCSGLRICTSQLPFVDNLVPNTATWLGSRRMGEFPEAAFVLGGDPTSIRASGTVWQTFGAAAGDTATDLRHLDSGEFDGDEADTFRAQVNQDLPPYLDTTGQAWTLVAAALTNYADALDQLQTEISGLRSTGWHQWQSADTAQANARQAASDDAAHAADRTAQADALPAGHTLPADTYRPAAADAHAAADRTAADLQTTVDAAAGVAPATPMPSTSASPRSTRPAGCGSKIHPAGSARCGTTSAAGSPTTSTSCRHCPRC